MASEKLVAIWPRRELDVLCVGLCEEPSGPPPFLATGAALAVSSALRGPTARAAAVQRVRPGMPGWPLETEWAALNDATNGRLSCVAPVAVLHRRPGSADPKCRL